MSPQAHQSTIATQRQRLDELIALTELPVADILRGARTEVELSMWIMPAPGQNVATRCGPDKTWVARRCVLSDLPWVLIEWPEGADASLVDAFKIAMNSIEGLCTNRQDLGVCQILIYLGSPS